MTIPRQVLPGKTYVIARRTTQRQFLLLPDDVTNNTFSYCLADSAQRYGISLIAWLAMSNHYHAVVYDRFGQLPAFLEHLHRSIAQEQNRRWERAENFWSNAQTSVVLLPTKEALISKVVYVLANPINGLLVDRVVDWPGASSFEYLDGRRTTHRRPWRFFSETGRMPPTIDLGMTLRQSGT